MRPHPRFCLDKKELFNILVSEKRLRHRDLRKKINLVREFVTGYIVLLSKQLKSIRKDGVSHKLVFFKRDLHNNGKDYTKLVLASEFDFL